MIDFETEGIIDLGAEVVTDLGDGQVEVPKLLKAGIANKSPGGSSDAGKPAGAGLFGGERSTMLRCPKGSDSIPTAVIMQRANHMVTRLTGVYLSNIQRACKRRGIDAPTLFTGLPSEYFSWS